MPIPCFLLTETGKVQRFLRRIRLSSNDCPFPENHGTHRCLVYLDTVEHPTNTVLPVYEVPHNHPFWPGSCLCGMPFAEEDRWDVVSERIYSRSDGGPETTLKDAPAGAMWDAWWLSQKGPDGKSLVVRLNETHDWCVDGLAEDGSKWTRSGEAPKVTAHPSIGVKNSDGSWKLHFWLKEGVLVET